MTVTTLDLCADPGLLSVEAARATVAALVAGPVGAETLPFAELRGRVTAEPTMSPTPLPPFDHSAMDGYALADLGLRHVLRGRLAAGSAGARETLKPGDAVRIFTGAPMPPGAIAVVMQERVTREGDVVALRTAVEQGANIRRRGEDVSAGDLLVPAGALIDARHLAILAASGVERVAVRRKVVIGLLSTGDELIEHGRPLTPGRIHDANRPMLLGILSTPAHEVIDYGIAPDDPAELTQLLIEAGRRCDALVTSGATSVGEEDHLAAAVAAAGGQLGLAKVALKPGKPIVAGRVGGAALVGLPGNPFAALVGQMLIGRVVLERLAGLEPRPLAPLSAVAAFGQKGPGGRTEFAPAALVGTDPSGLPRVEKLGRGGSARLAPLIAADGLAVIPAGHDEVKPGDAIGFLPFRAALEV
ncbi:molybdopterin molybdotransferase [Methylopila capsulata]|uniref:Molybdopterin molybdenumtransferase n=1 Tax=Methylopila capsulata TaxID=61654 RepID=A0A9W6ISL6_9HYPH|nr:gephyrin-like molybdotransferase Glp [Methylopila capsulata]MBM7850449.1 molybdopterin molybdotransferase [Methylopila capsulata]GLK55743.1 molybdopterin molybdenumtransferase MoeA [Methylopila capsulata]